MEDLKEFLTSKEATEQEKQELDKKLDEIQQELVEILPKLYESVRSLQDSKSGLQTRTIKVALPDTHWQAIELVMKATAMREEMNIPLPDQRLEEKSQNIDQSFRNSAENLSEQDILVSELLIDATTGFVDYVSKQAILEKIQVAIETGDTETIQKLTKAISGKNNDSNN